MPLETYLDILEDNPFIFQASGKEYSLPNFNSLSWRTIFTLITQLREYRFDEFSTMLPKELDKRLTFKQRTELLRAWGFECGVNISHLAFFIDTMEENDTELEWDLRTIAHIDGILGLLKLRPVEAMDVLIFLVQNCEESWLFTRVRNRSFPYSMTNWILADLVQAWIKGDYKRVPTDKQDEEQDMVTRITKGKKITEEDRQVTHEELLARSSKKLKPKELLND